MRLPPASCNLIDRWRSALALERDGPEATAEISDNRIRAADFPIVSHSTDVARR